MSGKIDSAREIADWPS